MSLAQRLERSWYEGAGWLWCLRPLELLFRAVVALRRALYLRGVLKVYRPRLPVIVVGNITVGGTGKTPVVIALVEALQAAGRRPGVVSRGYGGSSSQYPHIVGPASAASEAGDEPLLIQRRTGAPCVVDPVRSRAAAALEERGDVDIIVCDDGLQHYGLARDFEIVLIDAQRGIGNGWCLPAGPLREPESRLNTVDWVLYRGGNDEGEGEDEGDNRVRYQPAGFMRLDGGERRDQLDTDTALPLHAVAGIGQPAQFFATLHAMGLSPIEHVFADHHAYHAADFDGLDEGLILMTEKDAVKCADILPDNIASRVWYLRIDTALPAALVAATCALSAAAQPPRGPG